MTRPRPNAFAAEHWRHRVHALMADGLGYEDIAVRLGCPVADVRAEAVILAAEGRLDVLYAGRRA